MHTCTYMEIKNNNVLEFGDKKGHSFTIKLKEYFFFFTMCPQRLAFLSIGHHALLPQPYFVQLVKFQICLLLILNMLNHGVMDYTK